MCNLFQESIQGKIVAEMPFEFESKVQTRKRYEQENIRFAICASSLKNYENVLSEQGRSDIKAFRNESNAMPLMKVE
jgi:hypothetical protein